MFHVTFDFENNFFDGYDKPEVKINRYTDIGNNTEFLTDTLLLRLLK